MQGYKDGTAERYVEDENSETGFRKMTLDEELAGLDKAFQKMADGAGVKEMISGEFNRLASKAGRWHGRGRMPIRFPAPKRAARRKYYPCGTVCSA